MWLNLVILNVIIITILMMVLRENKNIIFKVFIAVFIFLGSSGLYLYLGNPGYPDQPIEARRQIMQENLADWLLEEQNLDQKDPRKKTISKMINVTAELLGLDPKTVRQNAPKPLQQSDQ